MSKQSLVLLGCLAASCLGFVCFTVAQAKPQAPSAKVVDNKDAALRDLARLAVAYELNKRHWRVLETDHDFKSVISQISDAFVPEDISIRWKATVIPVSKFNAPNAGLDDFERIALAAIQGGEDEPSLIGGEPVVRYARAIRAKAACVPCHVGRGDGAEFTVSKANDILGMVSLQMVASKAEPAR